MMPIFPSPQAVPAVVAGGGLNALGVVRSLGSAGVPVWVLDTSAKSPAMRSRFAHAHRVGALEGDAFIRELHRLVLRVGGRAVLFLTEEKTVSTVSASRGQLPTGLMVRLPEHARLMQLMHKQGFQELADSLGAAVPPLVRLQGLHDLPKVHNLKYPCVLKPSEKSYEYGARFKKAYKVTSAQEVEALYREIEPVLADMVVQEWIEGSDGDIYFCLQYIGRDGEVVGSFPGRKIRSWPPRIGGTASCTSAWEHAQELHDTTAAFFRAVGFTGMGSMEYKLDRRDGRFYMVEPTVGRTDFQEEVSTLNGCNLPLMAYRHELGLPLPVVLPPQPPRIWREAQIDRWSKEEGDGQIDEASRGYVVRDAYHRWNDLQPWFDRWRGRLIERFFS